MWAKVSLFRWGTVSRIRECVNMHQSHTHIWLSAHLQKMKAVKVGPDFQLSKSGSSVGHEEGRLNGCSSVTQKSKILVGYSSRHMYSVLRKHWIQDLNFKRMMERLIHLEANISNQLRKSAPLFPPFGVSQCVQCHAGCHDPLPVIPRCLWLMIREIYGWYSTSRLVHNQWRRQHHGPMGLLIKVEPEESELAVSTW